MIDNSADPNRLPVASKELPLPSRKLVTLPPFSARILVTLLCWLTMLTPVSASTLVMKNGMEFEGAVAPLASMAQRANHGGSLDDARLIVFVDDGLRRTYVSFHNVEEVRGTGGEAQIKFDIKQPIVRGGKRLSGIGSVLKPPKGGDWDKHGRRIIRILLKNGPVDIIQGMTVITPTWIKLESLRGGQALVLDMRIATSSISSKKLRTILSGAINEKNPTHRLEIVQFYLQAYRYNDALRELQAVIKDFPKLKTKDRELNQLNQIKARWGLDELERRRAAGQIQLVRQLLENFPSEGIAGEILIQVRELIDQYNAFDKQIDEIKSRSTRDLKALGDVPQRDKLEQILVEIHADLNTNTLGRMGSYYRLSNDPDLANSEKVALAASGWLLGADDATNNLAVARSLVTVRGLIGDYVNEPLKTRRQRILSDIRSQEAGVPSQVAKLVAMMKPLRDPGEPVEGSPGLYQLSVPGIGETPPVNYHVQLPPEYSPYRRYPTIVTLAGAETSPERQIEYWAGKQVDGKRFGQAARHGYIVIAPEWARTNQKRYYYSAREHAAVLDSLRDAMRKFAIDSDRVFLSGHAMGGDAAWDMALAHPDLWAGAIPISAQVDSHKYNYCTQYWKNAKHLPFYFVMGELDGTRMVNNASQFDRYLQRRGFDCMVVEYKGRGYEHFLDEVIRIYEWMERQERDFSPKEFETYTMRSWDSYFWWVELGDMPSQNIVDPQQWPPRRGSRPVQVTASIRESKNLTTIRVKSGSEKTTILLSPELVDFNKRIRVLVSGLGGGSAPRPDVETLLEDVRTRGDRQHPFWARVDLSGGR